MKDFFKKHLDTAIETAKSIGSGTADKTKSAAKSVSTTSRSVKESISVRMDRRTLEKNLVRRKELAREYEQNRVPAGDPYYVTIFNACIADLKQFCDKHGEDMELTIMQYPFLRSLKAKAQPENEDDRKSGVLAKAFAAVAAAAVICFLSGAATGLYHGGNELVRSFFGS